MSHKKRPATNHTARNVQTAPAATPPQTKNHRRLTQETCLKAAFLLLLFLFCTTFYGALFQRAQQEAFVCGSADAMSHMLRQPLGHLAWAGRWMLAAYKSLWVGGLVMTALLAAIAWIVKDIFRIQARWRGLCWLPSLAILFYFVCCGLNLYYKSEAGWIMLLPVLVLLLLFVVDVALRLGLRKRGGAPQPEGMDKKRSLWIQPGTLTALLLTVGLFVFAGTYQRNAIAAARQQLAYQAQDWDALMEEAMAVGRPTRVVAAYNAIGALRTDQLLDQLFAIPYNYPDPHLRARDGNEEYGLLQADCDLEAGLVQVAYHYYLEYMVMNGPSTYGLKNLALCAILQGQRSLAEKYLTLLSRVPFEGAFVARYRPMLDDPSLVEKDEHLASIRELAPREDKFEQQYRQPAFLGYNMGLQSGPLKAILTSVAACLYSKDLKMLPPRLAVMKQQNMSLGTILLQAICCMSIKNPDILKQFPEANVEMNALREFLLEAAPYQKDKDALRKHLKADWLGTYFYYYYTENNSPEQTGKATTGNGAVN